jgi:hypothetical protein
LPAPTAAGGPGIITERDLLHACGARSVSMSPVIFWTRRPATVASPASWALRCQFCGLT